MYITHVGLKTIFFFLQTQQHKYKILKEMLTGEGALMRCRPVIIQHSYEV